MKNVFPSFPWRYLLENLTQTNLKSWASLLASDETNVNQPDCGPKEFALSCIVSKFITITSTIKVLIINSIKSKLEVKKFIPFCHFSIHPSLVASGYKSNCLGTNFIHENVPGYLITQLHRNFPDSKMV